MNSNHLCSRGIAINRDAIGHVNRLLVQRVFPTWLTIHLPTGVAIYAESFTKSFGLLGNCPSLPKAVAIVFPLLGFLFSRITQYIGNTHSAHTLIPMNTRT
jgi:hypothetical protein